MLWGTGLGPHDVRRGGAWPTDPPSDPVEGEVSPCGTTHAVATSSTAYPTNARLRSRGGPPAEPSLRRSDGGEKRLYPLHEQCSRLRVVGVEGGVGEEVLVAGIHEELGAGLGFCELACGR
jgi:hypothetical protein